MENNHRQVPFHLLKEVPELSVGDPGSGNLLVEGDNLLALKALLPYSAFICKLEDGRILAVEYKNSRDYDLPNNEEKRRLGALWEIRSGGKCLFVMPRGKDFEGRYG